MKLQCIHASHRFALVAIMLLHLSALADESKAPPSLAGIWKWTFTMPDGSEITPKLELKDDAGRLTGITRLRAGTEAPVTNLTLNGDQLSFQVARERDGAVVLTRYTGTWRGDTITGKIVSNWTGEERSYKWEAHRATDADGVWKWNASFGGSRSESRLTLKQQGEKLTGKISASRGGDNDIKRGKFKDGAISFEVERDRDGETLISRYYGKLSGNKIEGKMELNFFGQPRTNVWEAVRAD